MRRDLSKLSAGTFDLLIVGAGIYGACVAWDAALRGLSVALLDQGDFGQATSSNSQKIVHGGFRYLQHLDVVRIRESVQERKRLMRIAPHLVDPMPCLLPTYRRGIQRRAVMRVALALYDLLSADRNAGVRDAGKRIPAGRVVSREECLRLAPGLDARGVTGGAVWHDGQISNTERLTLAFVRAAADRGACVANYVRVAGAIRDGQRVTGLRAEDVLTGRTLELRGRLVINTAGPWVNRILSGAQVRALPLTFSKTLSLVLSRPVTNGYAISVVHGSRRLFITPWRGRAIIGSLHRSDTARDECAATTDEVDRLIADVNDAYPSVHVTRADVALAHAGWLPRHPDSDDPARLAERYRICDHARTDGVEGLMSVVGIKYTTARNVAEKAVALAMAKLGRPVVPSRSAATPVRGGAIPDVAVFIEELQRARPHGLEDDALIALARNYGSDVHEVLAMARDASSVFSAQVAYAVREEAACTLADVVFRRTELGTAGHPGRAPLRACAEAMARECGWNEVRMLRELEETEQLFARRLAFAPQPERACV